ncbi:hypothetical protein BK809_0005298 [Diplodia seriata]|uniref:Gfd2/YDR514C-like C-terminal domain-containing protein n=1 Tax=Diplodia seriata TaxID=420778 RepID=A0A1S8BM94_9PEZI|nr:hypothetical protein BK809_0005298 [Diplodia seriata]
MPSSPKAAEGTPDSAVPLQRPTKEPSPATLALLRRYLGLHNQTDPQSESTPVLEPIFVAIDVEAYERETSKITEVGIAKLDSRTLPSPPATASDWTNKIHTQHYIIEEYQHLLNKRFVKGCPDKFQFGRSRIVPLLRMRSILRDNFTIKDENIAASPGKEPLRDIVLVGHDVGGDLKWMSQLGFPLAQMPRLAGLVDTRKLTVTLNLPNGLEKLLHALGEKPEYLHNGGNDANWTMQSALLLALYGSVFPEPTSMAIARQVREEKMRIQEKKQAAMKQRAQEVREAKEKQKPQKLREAKQALRSQSEGVEKQMEQKELAVDQPTQAGGKRKSKLDPLELRWKKRAVIRERIQLSKQSRPKERPAKDNKPKDSKP